MVKVDRLLNRLLKENTSPGLHCTATGCKGKLVRKPNEQFKGSYGLPECEICETVYTMAKDVPKLPRAKKAARR